MIIHATNGTNLLSGGRRSKILSDILWKYFLANLDVGTAVRLHDKSAILLLRGKRAYAYESGPRGEIRSLLVDYLVAIGSKYASNKDIPAV